MAHFYHVTAQRPTATVAACVGNFCGPDEQNLIVCKSTYVEVFRVEKNGLKHIKDIPFNASIITIKIFRKKNARTDLLFVLTSSANVAIISCSKGENGYEFHTEACGSVEDRGARMLDNGCDALVDSEARYIIVRLYKGILKVISLDEINDRASQSTEIAASDFVIHAFNVRIEEYSVIDMAFLDGYNLPTFAMIYQDDLVLHMKTCEIYGREPCLRSIPPTLNSIDPDSKILIPVEKPIGGVVILGDKVAVYLSKEGSHLAQYIPCAQNCRVLCYAKIDMYRYLLGDVAGRLYMLHLFTEESGQNSASSSSHKVGSVRIELLGEIVIPECIVYLDNGVVFVGSAMGDSQLIRLNSEMDPERNSYITLLDEFTNIGSILDMCLLENKGQNQLITCSNASKEGSLRLILNGIGIHEHACIDQELTKSIWCFSAYDEEFDDVVAVSLVGVTQLFKLTDDDLSAVELEGFSLEETLFCTAMRSSERHMQCVLQATLSGLRLVGVLGLAGKGLLAEWSSPTGRNVSCVSAHLSLVLVASGADLYCLRVEQGQADGSFRFTQLAHRVMANEVACMDLTPYDAKRSDSALDRVQQANAVSESDPVDIDHMEAKLAAVGLWLGSGLVLLRLPDLQLEHEEGLPETTQSTGQVVLPRSILIAQLEDVAHLFVAMGDGTLYLYTFDSRSGSVSLTDSKKMNAGTGPTMYLRMWRSQQQQQQQSIKRNVFVCSNHPCVIHSAKQKLVFANVNLQEVAHMSVLNSRFYRDCICLVTPTALLIGSVDEIQKLHIRTVHLEETPRRLALQPETGSLAVISYRQEVYKDGVGFTAVRNSISLSGKVPRSTSQLPKTATFNTEPEKLQREVDVSSLLIFDKSNLELQACHTFFYNQTVVEWATSVTDMRLDSGVHVYAVGTAFLVESEMEASRGRIHLFRWDEENGRLSTLLVHDILGSPYCLRDFGGKLLAGISSSVRLFEVLENSLRLVCSYNENTTILSLKSKNDFVLVGDLMRSVSLLLHRSNVQSFDVIGRHRQPRWLTCSEILDEDHFIASESERNLYVVTRDSPENLLEPSVRALFVGDATSDLLGGGSGSGGGAGQAGATGGPGRGEGAAAIGHAMPPSSNAAVTENRRLVDCAYMHVGDLVNTIVPGNLVLRSSSNDSWPAVSPTAFMFGTVKGSLGQLFRLSPVLFGFLKEVESRLAKVIVPMGGFSHESWRALKMSHMVKMAHNFVDGDLIEMLLDLSLEDKQKVVSELRCPVSLEHFGVAGSPCLQDPQTKPCTVDDLTKIVEELSRLH